MDGSYWRVAFVQPSPDDEDRCVMLHGELGEMVGPMTVELAEAWMDQFDNRPREAAVPVPAPAGRRARGRKAALVGRLSSPVAST
jgi:hypothetical protein